MGTTIGMVAGYLGGRTDNLLMRLTDVIYAFPDLLFFIIVMVALRDTLLGQLWNGMFLLFVALAIVNWVGVARLVRGQVLTLRGQEFIEASRALGSSQSRIIMRHLIPNSLAPIIVAATLGFGAVIIAESALSFLGFGVMPPVPTWGNMLNEARQSPLEYLFVQALSPGLMIFIVVLSINFIGDGLRDALDPRLSI
jgi:ABC-type dipeptide/oligopeptide/nickel transport system permease subunit